MDANTDGTGRAEEKWLLSNLKSTQAATWTDLLKHLKEKGMYDVANDIEHLFTNRSLESPLPSPVCTSVHGPMSLTFPAARNRKADGTQQVKEMPTSKGVLDTKFEREYELKEELGKGGFGVVYHVRNKFDHGHFALKIIKLPKSKHQQDKVMREVHALVTLDHPRILRYYTSWSARVRDAKIMETLARQRNPTRACAEYAAYTIGSADYPLDSEKEESSSEQELPYCLHIQTQLCNKDTLKDWLKNNIDNRNKKTVLGFFEQIHEAVVYIHQKGLLHRDLNPSNVFLSREGGSVKVGDFGLVSGLDVDDNTTQHEGQQKQQSHCGQVGKWLYMPPEQRAGKNYDEKVDIYALGVIFFELNCPFSTPRQRLDVLMELQSQQKLPTTFSERLPKEAKLIELMLSTDPAKRPSAKEISESDCLKILRETIQSIERSGTTTIPAFKKAVAQPNSEDSGILVPTPSSSLTESPDFDDQAKVNLETSKEVTTTNSLRGMKVVAATTFHLSGRRQTHVWEGHGLGLHLPEGALPPNHTGCRVDVRAGLAGQFEFSEGSRPVSGMYWLSCKETFLQSVTLELQHCVIVRDASQCSRLRFAIAKCSQPELPYKFKSLDRGYVFIPNSSYGSISLSQFSIVVITEQTSQDGEGSQEPQQPLQHAYCAKLFYLHEVSSQWQLDFIITQDLELYHKHVDETYTALSAKRGPHLEVQFEEDNISLNIPDHVTVVENGWKIVPLTPPLITKEQVDNFKPGRRIPTCQLLVVCIQKENPVDLYYKLNLLGAKQPYNFMYFSVSPGAAATDEKRLQHDNTEHENVPEPILKELLKVKAGDWYALGLNLDVSEDELDCIEKDHSGDVKTCRRFMFRKWQKHHNTTYQQLVEALEAIGEKAEAARLRKKYGLKNYVQGGTSSSLQ